MCNAHCPTLGSAEQSLGRFATALGGHTLNILCHQLAGFRRRHRQTGAALEPLACCLRLLPHTAGQPPGGPQTTCCKSHQAWSIACCCCPAPCAKSIPWYGTGCTAPWANTPLRARQASRAHCAGKRLRGSWPACPPCGAARAPTAAHAASPVAACHHARPTPPAPAAHPTPAPPGHGWRQAYCAQRHLPARRSVPHRFSSSAASSQTAGVV